MDLQTLAAGPRPSSKLITPELITRCLNRTPQEETLEVVSWVCNGLVPRQCSLGHFCGPHPTLG